ncbi:MAG: hypothetical protein Q9161_008026 [Pseudevernia consocians]
MSSDTSSDTLTHVHAASQPKTTRPSHWQLVSSHALLTPAVLNHKYNGSGTEEDPYRVEFIPSDPRDPMGFAMWKKWAITLLVAFATLAVAFVSSAYTGGVDQIISGFHTSDEVVVLGVSLFVLGFAIGPLLWAPLSELYGRQILFFTTYGVLTAFNAGAAGAQNIQTLIILRFFAGAFGSSPLTNAGGVIADMFPASQRGLAMSVFAAAPFMGPTLGPIVGGFLGETKGWRWVEGLMAIFTGALWIIGSLTIPETYAPVLLKNRAAAMSKKTGKVYKSKIEYDRGQKQSLSQSFKIALSRPWVLLLKEPIVLLLSIYMAIIYGTLYMMFAAFPIVYQQNRHWSEGIGGLAFLGVAVGMIGAVIYTIPDNNRYLRAEAAGIAKGEVGAAPEARLPPAMIGSVCIPIGLFIFAWTNYPSIHWIVSIIFTAPFGFGMVLVFLSIMNYLIDSYTIYAASVLAANSVLRSMFGTIFPLFTTYMYDNLGIHWASTIPAFLALACVPFPYLFYKYGPVIRKKCKFAREAAEVMAEIKQRQPKDESIKDEESDSGDSEKKVKPTMEPEGVEAARSDVKGDGSRLQDPERDVEKAEV